MQHTLNVEVTPTSAWATVRGAPETLDQTQNILDVWSMQLARGSTGWRRAAHQAQRVWLRQSPQELEVLLGALLATGQQVEWELGLPGCATMRAHSQAVAALRALPEEHPHALRDYQASAVLAALAAPWGRGVLSVPTAGGKTRIACAIADVAGGSWTYLVPNQELARQTQAEAPGNLYCASYGTAELERLRAADGIIVDECHRVSASTHARVLMRSRARWRIGMSGTPLMRSDSKNALVIGLLGPVVYEIQMTQLRSCNAIAMGVVRSILI